MFPTSVNRDSAEVPMQLECARSLAFVECCAFYAIPHP
jgi:hypothetical protein